MMHIPVKNMVCARCIKSVTGIMEQSGVGIKSVKLGEVITIEDEMTSEQERIVRDALLLEGFEWIDGQRSKLTEQIKNEIVLLVSSDSLDDMKQNLSDYLAQKLYKDYKYLSNVFSSIENITIEQFFILQKIEKVKELLVYGELTLGEIAFKLGYSSTAHLSSQFKKITGFTPSLFRQLKEHTRKPIDKV